MESGPHEHTGAENIEQGNTGSEPPPLGAPQGDDTRPNDEERAVPGSAVPESAAAGVPDGGFEPAPTISPAEAAAAEARAPEQPIAPGYEGYAAAPPQPGVPPAPYQPYQRPYQPRSPYGPQGVPLRPYMPARSPVPWWGWLIAGVLGVLVVTIIGCCVLTGLAAGFFAQISREGIGPETTQTLSKTFAVDTRPTLTVHDTAGNVTVTPGTDGQVVVDVTKRLRGQSSADAQRILDALVVDVTQDGNTITVQTHFPSTASAGLGGSPTVDVHLTAPAASQFNADLAAGNVTIDRIGGQMVVSVTAGNIDTRDAIFAGASHFSTTAGNITLDGVMNSGSLLQVQVTTGNITLRVPAVMAGHVDARTDVGTISVNGWSIPVTRVGTTGAQAVGDLSGGGADEITLRVNTGNITIGKR